MAVRRHPGGSGRTMMSCLESQLMQEYPRRLRTLLISMVPTWRNVKLTLVVDNLPRLLKVDWVDAFIVSIILIPRNILDLSTMSRATGLARLRRIWVLDSLVEEESIIGSSSLDEPMHRLDDVGLVGDLSRVGRVICEHYYIFGSISVSF